jgi:hypothetical protein
MLRHATGDLIMNDTDQRAILVDLRIPFFRLVFFFVKSTLAMIPAAIILTIIFSLLGFLLAAVFGDGWTAMMRLMQTMKNPSTL